MLAKPAKSCAMSIAPAGGPAMRPGYASPKGGRRRGFRSVRKVWRIFLIGLALSLVFVVQGCVWLVHQVNHLALSLARDREMEAPIHVGRLLALSTLDIPYNLCQRGAMGMDLDISAADVAISLGRKPVPFSHHLLGELEPADLARLSCDQGITAPNIRALNDRHHALAKALASGHSPAQASLLTGYSSSRISILKADPAFVELVEFYRSTQNIIDAQVLDRLGTLSLTAVAELENRLETEPEKIETRDLVNIAELALDRTGHGPSHKLSVTSLTLGPEDMAKLALATQEGNVRVIDSRATSKPAGGSDISVSKPLAISEAPRVQSQGDFLRECRREEASPVGQAVSGDESTLGPMAEVQGQAGLGPRAAGPLRGDSEHGDTYRMQAETEHVSGAATLGIVQAAAGETVPEASIHNSSVPALEIQAERVPD